MRRFLAVQEVESRLSKIFRRHGAVALSTPLLLPKNLALTRTARTKMGQKNSMELVDRSGMILSLPYDSRFGFARFLVKNQISRLKRFSFDRVYRDRGIGKKWNEPTGPQPGRGAGKL